MDNNKESTITFSIHDEKTTEMKKILVEVYNALSERDYDPINQIVGYILSEDPTYITSYKNARNLIRKIDRDELLHTLVSDFITKK